ncbi:MAG: hypothetical protein GX163_07405 [Bacteroidetes bacterium]|nr:hypothetical protein [Bacteroidota bacterium]
MSDILMLWASQKNRTDEDYERNVFLFFLPTHGKTTFDNPQMAHLVLPDTQADPSQNQKSHFLPTLQKRI